MNRIISLIKWIVSIVIILTSIFMFKTSVVGGLLCLFAGLLLFPPSLKFIQDKTGKNFSSKAKYTAIVVCIFLGIYINGPQKTNKKPSSLIQAEETVKPIVAFQDYRNENANLPHLEKGKEEIRNKILKDLNTNQTYIDLVKNKALDQKYLILLQAIGYGLVNTTTKEQFSITETLDKKIKNIDGGHKFVIDVIRLDLFGGITDDLLDAFHRYVNEYKMSGYKGHLTYNANGTVRYKLNNDFNLLQLLAVIDRKNPKVLDAYYEAVSTGEIDWLDDEPNYVYFYLTDKYAFNTYLKQNHPDSKYYVQYDITTTAPNLYQEYDENEVVADEKYKDKKIAVTGTIQDIGKDVMDDAYITLNTDNYGIVQCSFNNSKMVRTLSKGDRITVVGNCSGKTLGNVILFDSTLF